MNRDKNLLPYPIRITTNEDGSITVTPAAWDEYNKENPRVEYRLGDDGRITSSPAKPDRIHAFLKEVVEVSKRHGLCISHEDGGGAFEITKYDESIIRVLLEARDTTEID